MPPVIFGKIWEQENTRKQKLNFTKWPNAWPQAKELIRAEKAMHSSARQNERVKFFQLLSSLEGKARCAQFFPPKKAPRVQRNTSVIARANFLFLRNCKTTALKKTTNHYLEGIKRKRDRIIRTPSKLWQSPCHRARNAGRFKLGGKHRQKVRYNEEKHRRR